MRMDAGNLDVAAGIVVDFLERCIDAADALLDVLRAQLQIRIEKRHLMNRVLLQELAEALFVGGQAVALEPVEHGLVFGERLGARRKVACELGECLVERLHGRRERTRLAADGLLRLAHDVGQMVLVEVLELLPRFMGKCAAAPGACSMRREQRRRLCERESVHA